MPNLTQPLAPCYPVFTYLKNQLLCSWWRIPIHPFTPHRSNYNIYIDYINNTSRPRLAQCPRTKVKKTEPQWGGLLI